MRAITTANTVKYANARAHLASLNGSVKAHKALLSLERPYPAS